VTVMEVAYHPCFEMHWCRSSMHVYQQKFLMVY
jgi:hypothetical protein